MLDPERGTIDPDDAAYVILEPIQGRGAIASRATPSWMKLPTSATNSTSPSSSTRSSPASVARARCGPPTTTPSNRTSSPVRRRSRVGATISREEVFPEEKGRLSSTWGAGDILAAAQGALTIDAIQEYDLMDVAVERGRQFCERMRDETADVDAVADVRGKGLMLAVDFDSKGRRDAVQEAAFASGLFLLGCGHHTIRVLPPLDSTAREMDLGMDLLLDAIDAAS